MLSIGAGLSFPTTVHTASLANSKSVRLRTAFLSPTSNVGLGEVEAMLQRIDGKNMVLGYKNKSLERPLGMPVFVEDLFRSKTRGVWRMTTESKIPANIIAVNTEPGFYVLAPQEDMEFVKYKDDLEKIIFTRFQKNARLPGTTYGENNVPQTDKSGLEVVDSLIIQALERFIQGCFYHIGYSKQNDEIIHVETDIARARNYLRIYKQPTLDPIYDTFINAGTFARQKSKAFHVLRPKSELFRTIISKELQSLASKAAKAEKFKEEAKHKVFLSQISVLEEFSGSFFPPASQLPTPTRSSKKPLPDKLREVVDKVKQLAQESKDKKKELKAAPKEQPKEQPKVAKAKASSPS